MALARVARSPRARRVAAGALVALALFAALGFLLVPVVARQQLETLLGEQLGRAVGVGRVAFNPFTLALRVESVTVAGREPSGSPQFALAALEANAAWRSLYERAPVVESLVLRAPALRAARAADGSLDVDDVLRRLAERPGDPAAPMPRFAIANIAIEDGRIEFDDRVVDRRHEVAALTLRIPFVSSLPVHQAVDVEPKLGATVNGSALEASAHARPFAEDHASSLSLSLSPTELAPYLRYLPSPLPVQVVSAVAAGELKVDFAQPPGGAPVVSVGGQASLSNVEVRGPDGSPLLSLASLRASDLDLRPVEGRFEIGRLALDGADAKALRKRGEARFFERLLAAVEARASGASPAVSPGTRWRIGELTLERARVDMLDENFADGPLALRVTELAGKVSGIGSDLSAPLPFDVSATLATGERLKASGRATPVPLAVEADASIAGVGLKQWAWIATSALQADVVDGVLDVRARVRVADAGRGPEATLSGLQGRLENLTLLQRWDRRELLRVGRLSIDDTELDVAARKLRIGRVEGAGGRLALARDRGGALNLARALAAPAVEARAGAATAPSSRAASTQPSRVASGPSARGGGPKVRASEPAWAIETGRIDIGGWELTLADAAAGPAADLKVAGLKLQADGLGTARGRRGKVALGAKVGGTGSLDLRGELGLSPIAARLRVDAQRIGVLPMQPYFTPYVNALVSSGRLSARGDLAFALPEGGAPSATFSGEAALADFSAATKSEGEDLLRWKSLNVGGIAFALDPLKVDIGQVALDGFYARVVLAADGRLNLRDLVVDEAPAGAGPTPGTPAAAKPPSSNAATVNAPTASPAPAKASPVRIGRILLSNGNVQFSDFFVRPNYSANLTELGGTVGTMSADTAGDVELRGRVDQSGSVSVTGTLNPFASSLFLDLKASARDIDLPRTSPYAVKYLGYGIEKGKLSANVAYRIADRRLDASNNIVLDQLTFGERVDSPTATKLPVLFAVSLLKDRNGVIDVNMPIGGSLDDPEFSVGGLVLKIILNLIGKAVTAPFSLIANLFGGGAEKSHLEFAAGSTLLADEARGQLEGIAKALVDRPALRLDLTGHADPSIDREALRRATLERRLKAIRLRERAGSGVEAGSLDAIVIEPAERARLLAQAYRAADFPRPRNAIGLLRDQPVAEMERLLLEHATVDDDALRQLAADRAQAAKDWLIGRGGVPGERVFVVAPRIGAEGPGGGATPHSVGMSLR